MYSSTWKTYQTNKI
ncbi:unnamed protein product [Tuber melanosporum]|uniref:(Perigord truffle) hypothetical protein n=1 Tax=Tuber melanosporum (strain Mel28) TaxID=656061 RepID=D5GL88_TUBMM|nr:unnamed protein product [Tuber melanosporum]